MKSFNPRTREGCDDYHRKLIRDELRFNPRTREGCDELSLSTSFLVTLFQSTHPRRVRPILADAIVIAEVVSIHAPAKGATFYQYR